MTRFTLPLARALILFCSIAIAGRANHAHVQIVWRQGALSLEIYDFEAGSFPSDAFPFVVGAAGMRQIPPDPNFSFLGMAGATYFSLPQDGDPNLPFLGIGVGHAPNGVFLGNQVTLKLVSVDGPGKFSIYQLDAFGQPRLQMSDRDGITSSDTITLSNTGHDHQNWAFSAPGDYNVAFVATATLQSNGETVVSEPATYRFRVLDPPPVRLEIKRPQDTGLTLITHSRSGARIRLLESTDLDSWSIFQSEFLSSSTWSIPIVETGQQRFWRAVEVFD